MKAILASAVLSLIVCYWLPWWAFSGVLFIAGILSPSLGRALRIGFFSSFLVWAGWPLALHLTGSGALAPRLASAFHVPGWPLVFMLSGVIGAALGFSSAWLGYAFKRLTSGSRP